MLTLLTGAPGAGKSAATVQMLQDWHAKGRKIYVDIQTSGENAGKPSIPDLGIPHELLADARNWHEPGQVEDGSIIVLDEVQRVWRPAPAGSKVPADIAALETHRHRGLDFLLVTQGPALIHKNVRDLVGRHIHLRDVGILGRWWYEWPECSDPKQFRQAPVKKSYKLPKGVFSLYRSASVHVKPVRSIPRSVIILGVALVVLAALIWYAVRSIGGKVNPAPVVPVSAPGNLTKAPAQSGGAAIIQSALAVGPAVKAREPYAGFGVHLAGTVFDGSPAPRAWFAVSVNGQIVGTVKGDDLLKAGYSIRVLAPCVAVLIFNDGERVAKCDGPNRAPVQRQLGEQPAPAPAIAASGAAA